jgi:hypothetical protein
MIKAMSSSVKKTRMTTNIIRSAPVIPCEGVEIVFTTSAGARDTLGFIVGALDGF